MQAALPPKPQQHSVRANHNYASDDDDGISLAAAAAATLKPIKQAAPAVHAMPGALAAQPKAVSSKTKPASDMPQASAAATKGSNTGLQPKPKRQKVSGSEPSSVTQQPCSTAAASSTSVVVHGPACCGRWGFVELAAAHGGSVEAAYEAPPWAPPAGREAYERQLPARPGFRSILTRSEPVTIPVMDDTQSPDSSEDADLDGMGAARGGAVGSVPQIRYLRDPEWGPGVHEQVRLCSVILCMIVWPRALQLLRTCVFATHEPLQVHLPYAGAAEGRVAGCPRAQCIEI